MNATRMTACERELREELAKWRHRRQMVIWGFSKLSNLRLCDLRISELRMLIMLKRASSND